MPLILQKNIFQSSFCGFQPGRAATFKGMHHYENQYVEPILPLNRAV